MEENTVQDQQIESKADVKAEQYNTPKDIRLPLPGSLQEIVGSLLFASQDPLTAAEIRDAVKSVEPEEGENTDNSGQEELPKEPEIYIPEYTSRLTGLEILN